MAIQTTRHKGVTPPISLTLPTDAELVFNDALINELKKQNNFEGSEETERRYGFHSPFWFGLTDKQHRKKTLQSIQKVTTEFVKFVSKKHGLPQSTIDTAGGKIFTYGSYRLGVYGPGEITEISRLPFAAAWHSLNFRSRIGH